MSLHVTPLSWIRSCYNIPDGERRFIFAMTPDGFESYDFGFKPESGAKNDLLNRPCHHIQAHGESVLDDISQNLAGVSFKPTVANYAYNDAWFPTGFRLPCYYYGSLTTLNVALVITDGYTERSWSYKRSKQPGAVYPGLHEVYRTCYGKARDTFFKVNADLTPYGNQLMLRVTYDLAYAERNKSYKPNKDNPSSGTPEYFWGSGQLPEMTFQTEDMSSPVTIKSVASSWQVSNRYYLNLNLPQGMTLSDYAKEDPEIAERIMDTFMSVLKVNIKGSISHYGSAYSRGYDTVSSRLGDKSVKLSSSKLARFRADLRAFLERSKPDFPYSVLRGDATQSAANAAKYFAGNGIAYIQDLRRLKSTIFDLIGLLKGKKDLSSVANLWLSGRYGLKLTIQDTIDLVRGIKHAYEDYGKSTSTCRGVSRDEATECHAKLYYTRPKLEGIKDFDSLLQMLIQWDLYPTLENIWDLIPYSFVVDWFLGLGDILDGIDSRGYVDHMDIIGTCYTVKSYWVPAHVRHVLGLSGNVTASEFVRTNPRKPYQYIPHFSENGPSIKNIIDGSALIIQRL